jgi:hypothetical protein
MGALEDEHEHRVYPGRIFSKGEEGINRVSYFFKQVRAWEQTVHPIETDDASVMEDPD